MTTLVRQLHPGRLLARALVRLIRVYQIVLSPLLGDVCRFYPSCSRYAATCLTRFGLLRGITLAACRICRCHPFHPGGVDLPPAENRSEP